MPEVLRGAALIGAPHVPVDVVIDDGTIRAVQMAGTATGDVVDLSGLLLMPGAIDPHVHPIHDETFATVGSAAVFGGVTTVCNQLYPDPGEEFPAAIERMSEVGGAGTADFVAHVRWDRSRSAADVAAGASAGAVSIKVFLAHPDKSIQAGLGDLVGAMTAARDAGLVTLVHAELGDVVDQMLALGQASRADLASVHRWRSTDNEAAAIEAAAVVARAVDAPLYVVHASCADAMAAARSARLRGTTIHVETCPHYLFLDAESAPPGGRGFVLPPVRSPEDRAMVRRALADGLVDTVGSDHCGHGEAAKPHDIASAKAGLPGIEALLPLLLDAAIGTDPWLPVRRLLDVLCEGPARVFRLPGKGRLAPGYDADVVAVDPTAVARVDAARLHDAAGYSPYQGWPLRGRVERVWRRGELVVHDGTAVATGGGRLVRRAG